MVDGHPESFEIVRNRLPNPELVSIRPELRLDTLYIDGPDPPIVLIHGGLSNLWIWYSQLARFQSEHEILAYSLAGNGRSDDRDQHTLEGHVLDLADLLREKDIQNPIIVGWSYGTAIAIEYAKRFPTQGMLLTGGGAVDLTPAWEKPMMRVSLALRLYKLPSNFFMIGLAKLAAVHDSLPWSVVRDIIRANPSPKNRSAWEMIPEVFWEYDGRYALDELTIPTMVIHGKADRIVSWRAAEQTANLLPNCEFYKFNHAGHALPAERPCPFNELLKRLCFTARDEGKWPEGFPSCVENQLDG